MRINSSEAIERLKRGEVVSLPTETVYGLAASLFSDEAVASIFTLKGRPQDNPLIIHTKDSSQIVDYAAVLPLGFHELADRFWPGPLTLVIPAKLSQVSARVRAGLKTVGFRIPSHPLALEILNETGPLVMPSANLSGKPSATCYEHVIEDFGSDFPVVDGGECRSGVESTILIFRENAIQEAGQNPFHKGMWDLGRLGAVSQEALASVLGYVPLVHKGGSSPICPGQKYRHYAPKARLILEGELVKGGSIVGFSDRQYVQKNSPGQRLFLLGASSAPEEVAHHLYAVLRQLDEEGVEEAWVDMDFPDWGLWSAIRERLYKAGGSN